MFKKVAKTIGIGSVSVINYVVGGVMVLYGYAMMKVSADTGAKRITEIWKDGNNENE